jgi:hypothetical protein
MNQRDDTLALQCKVELADWKETTGSGCTLTLRVPDAESVSLLRAAFARHANDPDPRYLLHLLKMNEHCRRINPVRRERLENALKAQPLSRSAATLCRDPDFWRYLENIDFAAVEGEVDPFRAQQYINKVCNIRCRRELDRDSEAAEQYQNIIIKSFLSWLRSQA